jgi:hypothetical protein
VLILGAGASQAYGFPLGVTLRDQVCRLLVTIPYSLIMQQLGFERAATSAFVKDLSRSGFPSVDAFLEARQRYLDIGKAAIALVLLPYEQPDHLFPPHVRHANHWYEYLINEMGVGTSAWKNNRLTVLTFNYDRSFEHYFTSVIRQRAAVSERKAANLFKQVTIVHLHGQLGKHPGLGRNPVPYGVQLTPKLILRAAKGIRVISEAGDSLSTFRRARRFLLDAKRVYFLGFGFAQVSIERLGVFNSDDFHPVVLGGTSKGITDRQWTRITRDFLAGRWNGSRWRRPVSDFVRSEASLY